MTKHFFYTKTARIIATLAFVIGVLSLLNGVLILVGLMEPPEGIQQLAKFTGRSIDNGIYYIFFAVVLGVLSEISQSLSIMVKNNESKVKV